MVTDLLWGGVKFQYLRRKLIFLFCMLLFLVTCPKRARFIKQDLGESGCSHRSRSQRCGPNVSFHYSGLNLCRHSAEAPV